MQGPFPDPGGIAGFTGARMGHEMSVTRCWLLPFDTLAPATARARVADMLGRGADDAELVVSELVSNAIRHAHAPVELAVRASSARVRLEVIATHRPGDPTPVERGQGDGSGGAGLRLVAACSEAWSWELVGARLTVRADITLS